jgi:NTP pyrophosphatase (non-canonical NTP hydrolase)
MSYTLEEIIEKMMASLPEDYVIQNDDDALIKAAFTAEELGEVVKAIAHGTDREVVKECADTIVGLLQIMAFYNYEGPEGIDTAFDENLQKLRSR